MVILGFYRAKGDRANRSAATRDCHGKRLQAASGGSGRHAAGTQPGFALRPAGRPTERSEACHASIDTDHPVIRGL